MSVPGTSDRPQVIIHLPPEDRPYTFWRWEEASRATGATVTIEPLPAPAPGKDQAAQEQAAGDQASEDQNPDQAAP